MTTERYVGPTSIGPSLDASVSADQSHAPPQRPGIPQPANALVHVLAMAVMSWTGIPVRVSAL